MTWVDKMVYSAVTQCSSDLFSVGTTDVLLLVYRCGHVCLFASLFCQLYLIFTLLASLGSVEETFLGFATTCAQAGPQGCALAEKDSTGASVAQFVRDLIDVRHFIIFQTIAMAERDLHTKTAYELGKENIQNITSTTMRGS